MSEPGLAKQVEWVNQRIDRINDRFLTIEDRFAQQIRPLQRSSDFATAALEDMKRSLQELKQSVAELKQDLAERSGSQKLLVRALTVYAPGIVAIGSIISLVIVLVGSHG